VGLQLKQQRGALPGTQLCGQPGRFPPQHEVSALATFSPPSSRSDKFFCGF